MNRNAVTDDRIKWVDALKFLGIFAIYLGHFGEKAGKLYPFFYTYHVPLFFFVSGFFADIKNGETFLTYAKKRFRALIMPYFAFVVLSMLMHAAAYDLEAELLLYELQRYVFAVRNTLLHSSLWFFSCLFIVSLLHRLLMIIAKKKWIVLAISLVPACFCQIEQPAWFWNMDSTLQYLVYYALGNICFSIINKYRYEYFRFKGRLVYIILAMVSFLIAGKTYLYGSLYLTLRILGLRLPSQAEAFFTVINTSIILFANVQLAFWLGRKNLFGNIGKETLMLCGMEFVTKNILQSVFAMMSLTVRLDTPLMALLYTVLCVAVTYKVFVPILHKYFGGLLGTKESVSLKAANAYAKQIEKKDPAAML